MGNCLDDQIVIFRSLRAEGGPKYFPGMNEFNDLTKFITHALMHKIPLLWEIHKTHHSARVLTPITIFRTHPLEGVIFVLRSALTQGIVIALFYYIYGNNITFVTILGANLMSFWFHLLGSNLRHSHIWINYWNWLEKIFISPCLSPNNLFCFFEIKFSQNFR